MTDEVWWTRCEKCGELIVEHMTLTGGRLQCPKPKLADVLPFGAPTPSGSIGDG